MREIDIMCFVKKKKKLWPCFVKGNYMVNFLKIILQKN